MKTMKKTAKNKKETAQIAKLFLKTILKNEKGKRGAKVVCLSGNLGAGKTAFTQSVARHLGIRDKVTSPTFVIFKKYSLRAQKHEFLYHIDAYRLKKGRELVRLGWDNIIADDKNLVFIEWPENVQEVIPKGAHNIRISNGKGEERIFELK